MTREEIGLSTLQRAIEIAVSAHRGQRHKADEGNEDDHPYLLHPLHLMFQMESIDTRIVAVLHDAVEDSDDWDFERLRAENFSPEIVAAVESVTKHEGEDYGDFIQRVKRNRIGRCVKLADLRHNIDLTRLPEIGEKDLERAEKYHRAIRSLEEADSP